jgi:hypothetical protein
MIFSLRALSQRTPWFGPTVNGFARWRPLCALLFVWWYASAAHATTVVPPSFDALVNQSDYIVRTRVKSVVAEKRPVPQGVKIVTLVQVEILETVAGSPPQSLTLEIFGGKVGDEELIVEGMPRFAVGDEDILFVRDNGRAICPLYAMMHGRYGIREDSVTGRKYLTRADEVPLQSSAQVSAPLAESATSRSARSVAIDHALEPDEFVRQIRAAVKPTARLNRAK